MKKISIDLDFETEEKVISLISYLKKKEWYYTETETKSYNEETIGFIPKVKYTLGDDTIDGIKINQKIFDKEQVDYKIEHLPSLIDNLIRWISECKNQDKSLMLTDLKYLLTLEDEYVFSSITTNHYVIQGKKEFDQLCKRILKLNKKK